MSREIKFRVWDNIDYMSKPYDLNEIQFGKIQFTKDCIIMQFTGLKDMNGQDIYEGDVLQCEFIPSYFGVEWNNEVSCYDWYVMTETKKLGASLAKANEDAPKKTDKPFSQIIEVIGNIYENPDLLS